LRRWNNGNGSGPKEGGDDVKKKKTMDRARNKFWKNWNATLPGKVVVIKKQKKTFENGCAAKTMTQPGQPSLIQMGTKKTGGGGKGKGKRGMPREGERKKQVKKCNEQLCKIKGESNSKLKREVGRHEATGTEISGQKNGLKKKPNLQTRWG